LTSVHQVEDHRPVTDVSLQVSLELDDAQLGQLAAIFGVARDQLEPHLQRVAAAATEEYVLAFSGARSPGTMSEYRENRLNLLFKHLENPEPTDRQVERLFQRTPAQARTLIAGVRARYETEVAVRLSTAATTALKAATKVDDDTVRIIASDSLAAYLKDLVNTTNAPPLEKRKDASQTYDVLRDTVVALAAALGFDKTDVTALDW
jgi:hypothetical protein